MRKITDLYGRISVTRDGRNFAPYTVDRFYMLLRSFRSTNALQWAIYADIGGLLPDGTAYVTSRQLLACSHDYRVIVEAETIGS
jgi:hypothetical protein